MSFTNCDICGERWVVHGTACKPKSQSVLPADPLVSEMQSLAATKHPLCPEAKLLLEMAIEAQQGKPIDLTRLGKQ